MGSPPACKRGRLHRQGCSHRLYLAKIQAEKKPVAVQGTEYVFDAWTPSSIHVEKLTTDRLNRWAQQARHPAQGRSLQADRDRPPADARRARKATANRILTC